jgi:hypothetical protein
MKLFGPRKLPVLLVVCLVGLMFLPHAHAADVVVRQQLILGDTSASVPGFRIQLTFPVGAQTSDNMSSFGSTKPDYGFQGASTYYFTTADVDRYNVTLVLTYTTLLNATFGLTIDSGGRTGIAVIYVLFGNVFIWNFLISTVQTVDVAAAINDAVAKQRDFDLQNIHKEIDNPDPNNPGIKQEIADSRDANFILSGSAILVSLIATVVAIMAKQRTQTPAPYFAGGADA